MPGRPPPPPRSPDPEPEGDPVALADWIDAEPVPALRQFRDELAALAAEGQDHTEPVTDQLVAMIGTLEGVGHALRGENVLPAGLADVLAACTADLLGAQVLVEATRARVEQDAAPVDEAVRQRVREARAAGRASRTPGS